MLSLSFSCIAFSLGLGQIHLFSYLGKPLNLEIDLVDIGSVSLSSIHSELGSYSEYKQLSLERPDVLINLSFIIEQNYQGRPVLRIRSADPINEPYLPFLIDLAWPKGQLYKVYHVLLDPPEYNETEDLENVVVKKVSHTSKHHSSEYGPTQPGETIWQIAQRLKSTGVTLQQVILAMVSMNEQSFKEGNLNGLKQGQYLHIPSTRKIKQIPKDSASLEVSAHDRAWMLHESISHVLNPPYFEVHAEGTNNTPEKPLVSELIPIPKLKGSLLSTIQSSFSGESNISMVSSLIAPISKDQEPSLKNESHAKIGIAVTTIESLKEINALLKDQLEAIKNENAILKKKLLLNQKTLENLQKKMGQVSSGLGNNIDIKGIILMLIILALLIGTVIYLYHQPELWEPYIRRRGGKKFNETPSIEFPVTHPVALDTLLNLAQSYYDKGDYEAAKHTLSDIIKSGNDEQKQKAQELLDKATNTSSRTK